MPTPVGHAMAGVATVWIGELIARPRGPAGANRSGGVAGRYPPSTHFALSCAILAIVPDVDIVFGTHQTYTHSLGAVVLIAAVAMLVARRAGLAVLYTALICGAAYASHLLLDWLSSDSSYPVGIPVFWPLISAYYKSGADLFLDVSRRYWRPEEFIYGNLRSIAREALVLGPPLLVLRLIRVKTLARLAPQVARRNHPAK